MKNWNSGIEEILREVIPATPQLFRFRISEFVSLPRIVVERGSGEFLTRANNGRLYRGTQEMAIIRKGFFIRPQARTEVRNRLKTADKTVGGLFQEARREGGGMRC
jgi:hypothetical protein